MNRRRFVEGSFAAPLASSARLPARGAPRSRVRPGDRAWPSPASWERLRDTVGGRLIAVRSPLEACRNAPDDPACLDVFRELKNPYYIGDQIALTQTTGWLDAWTSQPSTYAVAAQKPGDVVAAVNFARDHNLRLVVKGGGHSYLGTSNAPDSLLIWTRAMDDIRIDDGFVARGCAGPPQAAVSVGAGAIWMHTYNSVTTQGGRYVQGGGCGTVGVAGLVQGGGFGSYSKRFGLAAASLLEAEIVTADGAVRIANPCTHPDLFWALKGGGGGTFGVVTRLTLRTHALPAFFGIVATTIRASSDAAFRRLVTRFLEFYADALLNPGWGEIVNLAPGNTLDVEMAFQGFDQAQAAAVWRPFLDWVKASPADFAVARPPLIGSVPGRHRWDPAFLKSYAPGAVLSDDRPGAPQANVFWASNLSEAGHFIHGFESVWLPASLLSASRRESLVDALVAASQRSKVELHFQKGLAGGAPEAIASARNTAMNPAVIDAFALAIIGSEGPPALPGLAGHEPDLAAARRDASAIAQAMAQLRVIVPKPGSYVAESNYFEPDWRESYWGASYKALLAVKQKYDPTGLFFVHHGVGSDVWRDGGFTRAV
jgi:FAD/FMN-containing dehydrogenase